MFKKWFKIEGPLNIIENINQWVFMIEKLSLGKENDKCNHYSEHLDRVKKTIAEKLSSMAKKFAFLSHTIHKHIQTPFCKKYWKIFFRF